MRSLSASELLSVWERGLNQSRIQQALLLLNAACPEFSLQQLAELSIGQRDGLILTLREWSFGDRLHSLVNCPACGERLEFDFQSSDIRVTHATEPKPMFSLKVAEYQIQFRLPNSLDLAACSQTRGNDAQQLLLERCLLNVLYQDEGCTSAQLSPEIFNAVIAEMADADPQADIQLNLNCPACHYAWQVSFDIVAFFWEEIQAWAVRLLREVHILASTYGWHEADILAMSPYRRQLYLEMVSK